MAPVIELTKLRHVYTDVNGTEFVALDGIDLTIQNGEFVAIIGTNGSGKSTLAKHLNALLLPTSGVCKVQGMDTKDEEALWNIRQTVGMVFQNPDNQIVAAVVEEDVAFGPENLGIPPGEIRNRVEQALTMVDMLPYRLHGPHLLSGGQKQRVAIAGVLAMRPNCMVLDEPTAMLDPKGRNEVLATVSRLNKEEKITIIYITHYMKEAVRADRVIVMDQGKILLNDTPCNIFNKIEILKGIGLDVPIATEIAEMLRSEGVPLSKNIITSEELAVELCRLS